jgi:hypothetical protein
MPKWYGLQGLIIIIIMSLMLLGDMHWCHMLQHWLCRRSAMCGRHTVNYCHEDCGTSHTLLDTWYIRVTIGMRAWRIAV